MSAVDVFEAYTGGKITREQLLLRLANLAYGTGEFPVRDKFMPGAQAELDACIAEGRLTEAEVQRILASARAHERQHTTAPLALVDA